MLPPVLIFNDSLLRQVFLPFLLLLLIYFITCVRLHSISLLP